MTMVKIIDVCSGKGGVGKTTMAANLGLALQRFGKRCVVIDCNLTTSHLSLAFGFHSYPMSLNHFLRNECSLEEATYTHMSGLKVVPASLELKDMVNVNPTNFRERLRTAFEGFDIILLDSAPSLGREALMALEAADEVLFVANPHIPSLVDVLKTNHLIGSMETKPAVLGVIVNRVRGRKYEVPMDEIGAFVEMPVIGVVPEDENVLESANKKSLVAFYKPYTSASISIFEIAARLARVIYKRPSRFEAFRKKFKKNHMEFYNHFPAEYGQPYGMV